MIEPVFDRPLYITGKNLASKAFQLVFSKIKQTKKSKPYKQKIPKVGKSRAY